MCRGSIEGMSSETDIGFPSVLRELLTNASNDACRDWPPYTPPKKAEGPTGEGAIAQIPITPMENREIRK